MDLPIFQTTNGTIMIRTIALQLQCTTTISTAQTQAGRRESDATRVQFGRRPTRRGQVFSAAMGLGRRGPYYYHPHLNPARLHGAAHAVRRGEFAARTGRYYQPTRSMSLSILDAQPLTTYCSAAAYAFATWTAYPGVLELCSVVIVSSMFFPSALSHGQDTD